MKKKKKSCDRNVAFIISFTTFLQQILNSRLLYAVIDGKKIISLMDSIVNVTLFKNKKEQFTKKFITFFTIIKLANFY